VAAWLALAPLCLAQAAAWDQNKVIAEATGGMLETPKGQYFDKGCGQSLDYEASAVDLNKDGQPEVFTQIFGSCLGGMTGVFLNLYIKDGAGRWHPQFGFPGIYEVLKTDNKGYPDIQIGGPGFCFPVWRWNGSAYALHRKIAAEMGGCAGR
jgi:hypothetical protein